MSEKPLFEEDSPSPKPAFEPRETVFEIDGDEAGRRRLPWKPILIAGGVLALLAALLFLLLPGEDSAQPEGSARNSSPEITDTVREFYQLVAEPGDGVCGLFAEGVFDPEDPLRACQSWKEENFPAQLEIEGPLDIEERGDRSLALWTLQEAGSGEEKTSAGLGKDVKSNGRETSEGTMGETGGETARENDLPVAEPREPLPGGITPRSAATVAPQGGAVLVEEGGSWKIVTLAGLPGTNGSESELGGELAEEYNLWKEGPLYLLPSAPKEEPVPEEVPSSPVEPAEPARFSCPGGKKFDLLADIRQSDFRLFGEQRAAAGGDIRAAWHSSGRRQSCLAVEFRDNYASVENLEILLSHNSWQQKSPASFLLRFFSGVPEGFIEARGRQRQSEISLEASSDGKTFRVTFPTPPEWLASSAPRQFWFLRSSFTDPLGSGSQLFDEGRPAGQLPPGGATNPEGGWPF